VYGGTVAAGGITSNPLASKDTTTNTNTINCQSKKGSTNTAVFGTLKYARGKCTAQNGGTIAAGGSNLTHVLLVCTILKDPTAIPILEDSLKDKNIYRTEETFAIFNNRIYN
jgi:hypothetical protein